MTRRIRLRRRDGITQRYHVRRTYGFVPTVTHQTRIPRAKVTEEIVDTLRRKDLYEQEGNREVAGLAQAYLDRLQQANPGLFTKVTDDLLIHRMQPPEPKRLVMRRNFGALPPRLYHGTDEQALARMVLDPHGLKPMKGVLYLTDDPRYARLRAREAAQGRAYEPIVLAVPTPLDVEREGRHFILRRPLSTRVATVTVVPRRHHDSL